MRSALWHLQRRALTEAEVRERLKRKASRAAAQHGPIPEGRDNEAALIDRVVERLHASLLLNDSHVAVARVEGARRQGRSKRRIEADLKKRGVSADDIAAAFVDDDGDLAAAVALVRKKGLLKKDPQRALSALARLGFSFDVAKRALAAAVDDDGSSG